jgi:hydrogenase maturation protein HypF
VSESSKPVRLRLTLTGQVQGVGFRPFVYRLARQEGLGGFASNDSSGVVIEVQGSPDRLERFTGRLRSELPPLASLSSWNQQELEATHNGSGFAIRPSSAGELADAQVTVDTAVCHKCLAEMADPADPRHAYAFISCTDCGPRYSIVQRIPYDRAHTTMSGFAMCPLCAGEYADPSSRRFHAQPVACPRCGPRVWLVDRRGRPIATDHPIAAAAELIAAGKTVAIKGLGGFHLACRADDQHAVIRLRRRKHREAKPFAIMVADLDQADRLCELTDEAKALLSGPIRPVVLLAGKAGAPVAPAVANGLATLGVMLPYTPLHHLLFSQPAVAGLALVMTSGNVSDEPLTKDNDAAVAHLGQLADALLLHDRPIARRIDDSVVQMRPGGAAMPVRRARGYAPRPVHVAVAAKAPAILAVGAELKSTFCLLRRGLAVVSEHIGDLQDARTLRHFADTVNHLEALYDIRPELIVADLHPSYLSSRYALQRSGGRWAGRPAVPLVRVQHHHAHVAACLAEHGRQGPVIGLACDGVGLGDDGGAWGGEVLIADLATSRRIGHLGTIPLIGGDAAARQTWRPALGALYETFGDECLEVARRIGLEIDAESAAMAMGMLHSATHCPPSSALGRWFDAAAGLCGVARANEYEGQAPMMLETAAASGVEEEYPFALVELPLLVVDLRPAVGAMVADRLAGTAAGAMAARFHNTIASALAAAASSARQATGLNAVVLTGGCFANVYMTERLALRLGRAGFEVLEHRQMPCNDGGVSLGQAVVAAARWSAGLLEVVK